MKIDHFLRFLLGFLLISAGAYAGSNHNPVAVSYVDQAIETAFKDAVQMTTYTAGSGITIQNNVISGGYVGGAGITVDNAAGTITQSPTYVIGEYIPDAEGVVFWLDSTNRHGLMIALNDVSQDSTICIAACTTITYTPGSGIGSGVINTAALIGSQLTMATDLSNLRHNAPFRASEFETTNGVGGWYLPSITELDFLFNHITVVNNTLALTTGADVIDDTKLYWSSSSSDDTNFYIRSASQEKTSEPRTMPHAVRPIRQF